MKVLVVHQWPSVFVLKDVMLLSEVHEVRAVRFTGMQGVAWRLIPDLVRLWRGVRWCDVTFSWFGKLHAFFAVLCSRMLGKRAVVIAGGDEVAWTRVGGRAYGSCAHPVKRWVVRWALRKADLILAVSESSRNEAVENAGADPGKTIVVYHGFDPVAFRRPAGAPKREAVVTVAELTRENVTRKGLELLVQAAHALRDVPIYLIGPDRDGAGAALRRLAPPNVVFLGGLYGRDLVAVLGEAAVYVQASEWESFGCSLAEAMLCECVPVASSHPALREVADDCAVYLNRLDAEALAEGVREALRAGSDMGAGARERIVAHFPLAKRREALLTALESLR